MFHASHPTTKGPDMPDTPETIAAAVQPIIQAVLAAEVAGDRRAVCQALHDLYALSAGWAFAGTCMLGGLAALRVRPAGSSEPYVPLFVDGETGQEFNPDDPAGAAHGFVGRFVVASINGDHELRRDLWLALIEPASRPERDEAAECIIHDACHLLVTAAVRGLAREAAAVRAREHRKHQHPAARQRTGHRLRRDQHRR